MDFKEYVALGKVKKVQPDISQAKGLLQTAEEDFTIVSSTTITAKNASFYFKNIYAVLRSGLEAFLSLHGFKSYSHEAILQHAFEKKLITQETFMRADTFRKLRHDIEYRAEKATKEETEEILALASKLLPKLKKQFDEMKSSQ